MSDSKASEDYQIEDPSKEKANHHADHDAEFGGVEGRARLEKKLLRKVDLRMCILIIIYVLNYIDRNNAAAARLRGFEEDLGLKGQQFATLLSILYVGYITMQVPSNMFLNYIGKPSWYLPACMAVWGMISVLTGITHNFVGALLTRFFLGFVEAAFFPGALFLLSKWYKREELGLRNAVLYCGNLSSNAFGGLLAAGILDGMEGVLGHRAWRWLFYIEGALTIAVAVIAIPVLPDFPSTTSWLSPEEKRLAELRMEEDAGMKDEEEDASQFRGLKLALTDFRTWWLAIALTAFVVGLSFNAYFPTLTATMGYNRTVTLLLCAPPWGFATIVAFITARHSDKTQERTWHIIVPFVVGIIGFIISLSTMNVAARYIAMFLHAQSYAGFICFFAWISTSIPRPASKRAVAIAFINAFSQLGNIAGSYVWPNIWGPTFRYSYAITLCCFSVGIFMVFIFRLYLQKLNRTLEAEEKEPGVNMEELARRRGVPIGFRYML